MVNMNCAEHAQNAQMFTSNEQMTVSSASSGTSNNLASTVEELLQRVEVVQFNVVEAVNTLHTFHDTWQDVYSASLALLAPDTTLDYASDYDASRILWSLTQHEHCFIQWIILDTDSFFQLTPSEVTKLNECLGTSTKTVPQILHSLKNKFAVQSVDALADYARDLIGSIDDYEYSIYSGGLAKDYVKTLLSEIVEKRKSNAEGDKNAQ